MEEYNEEMLNFNSILLFSENPEALADFYKSVFEKNPDMVGDGYFGFMVGSGFFTIGPHDKVKGENSNPERVLLNFEAENVQQEFERIKNLGATVIAEPYQPSESEEEMWIATFADPDNNYFQLMSPWKQPSN